MKTIISLCFTLLFAININSQETITIPDIGLEECLIDLGIDSNGLNGSILVSDAKYVVNLNINDPITNKLLPNVHSKVKDLTGLEHFPNLKRIDCYGNNITKIDLSKSTSITFLNCSNNKIESLDLSNNKELNYVSCDSNKLHTLILGDNPNLESLYCSSNKLTSLNVEGCSNLESFDTTGNKLNTIIVSNEQLSNTPEGWYKDANTKYSNTLSSDNSSTNNNPTVQEIKKETTPATQQTTVAQSTPVTNNQSNDSAANYFQKFQLSVITEYDKSILNASHLQSKKDELQKKYNLNPDQLNKWIAKYSNLKVNNKGADTVTPVRNTATFLLKFKKSAVEEYEELVLNSAYLQSKKEIIQKKYNLNPEDFTKWINSFGNHAIKARTNNSAETTKSFYDKFKKSVVEEYEFLVLNATYIQNKKREIQQKYNLTATQLNEWVKKHSKVKTL